MAVFSFYVSQRKFDQAEEQIKRAVADNPGEVDLLITLGNFYLGMQKIEPAEAAYRKAAEVDPKSAKPYMVLAGFYGAIGQKDKSLEMYRRPASSNPRTSTSPTPSHRFYLSQGDIAEAEKENAAVLQKRPKYFPARMLQSELLIAKRDFGPAVELLNQLIQEEPKSARAHYFKGLAHFGQGDVRLAQAAVGQVARARCRQHPGAPAAGRDLPAGA